MKLQLPTYLALCMIFLLTGFLSIACTQGEKNKAPMETKEETMEKVSDAPKKSPRKMSLGEKTFIMCQACHTVKEGEPHKVGPNLYGFLGQKAGSKEGFTYSEALKESDIVWNEEHLRNWMKKPTDYIPGTIMAFVGIENEEQQTALIEYLKEQTQ